MNIVGITADGKYPLFDSMEGVNNYSWKSDTDRVFSTKGTGPVTITTPGAMNAIYGPGVQNLAYNKHNTFAVLGQQPYKTARRFQTDLSKSPTGTSGVVRAGFKQQPVFGGYVMCEMPYKVVEHNFAMDLGKVEIGNRGIDDPLLWEDLVNLEAETWLNNINADVVRRLEDPQFAGRGSAPFGSADSPTDEIVGYESIDRIISSSDEAQYLPAQASVPWKMAVPMPSSDGGNALAKYRDPSNPNFAGPSDIDCYVDHNYNSGTDTGETTLRQLTVPMVDKLFMETKPWRVNNTTDGTAIVTGYDTVTKLQALLQPQQRYVGQQRVQLTVNGINTVEGLDTGMWVSSYNGVPIIPDYMIPRGYGTTAGGHADEGVGRMYLLDNNVIYNGAVTGTRVYTTDNPLVAGRYVDMANMHQIGEIQVKGAFKALGKITHLK